MVMHMRKYALYRNYCKLQFAILEYEKSVYTVLSFIRNYLNGIWIRNAADNLLQIQEWERDENIGAILIKGVGEKAFCAGGDVRGYYPIHNVVLNTF